MAASSTGLRHRWRALLFGLLAGPAMAQDVRDITTFNCIAPHTPLLRAERFIIDARADAWAAAVELTNPGARRITATLSLDIAGTQHFTLHAIAAGETRRLDAGAIPRARWFSPAAPAPDMLAAAIVISCGPAELR